MPRPFEVGERVAYWKMEKVGPPSGEGNITHLGVVGGSEVAWIDTCRGCIALTHLERPAAQKENK